MTDNFQLEENNTQNIFIDKVTKIAVDNLQKMYLPVQFEFSDKKNNLNANTKLETSNTRYTLINLIGLYKAECHNYKINLDLEKILDHQIKNAEKYNGVGDLGLLLWATSLISPNKIPRLLTKVNFNDILTCYEDAKLALTTELAWFLTGLLMASTFSQVFKNSINDLTQDVYLKLRKNYCGTGIFRHQGNNSLMGKLRSDISNFADQIYSIYALTLFSQVMGKEESLLVAKECAIKICNLQGRHGEWYWHYNAKSGTKVNEFPIYSVNQIGLAPLALSFVQKASGTDFSEYIGNGINWIQDSNLVEDDYISNGLSTSTANRKFTSSLTFLTKNKKPNKSSIMVLKESSSYIYGWILQAMVGNTDQAIKEPVKNSIKQRQNLYILN